uniref:Kazal-like domain-containing protein n=1 Tax=Podarcis muralis TaxID=64176 RepID=A0A670IMV2_PODMU
HAPPPAVWLPHSASAGFLISDRDRDPQCNLHCSRSPTKPLCASDGRTYESMCDYQRAKCRDASLSVVHRGRCKGCISFTPFW